MLRADRFGCGGGGPPEFKGPPVKVVCTTTIVADLVKRVGGDRVNVDVLMGPGVDPHRYIPTAGDRAKLEGAHLVFFNGLHLEGKMTHLLEGSANGGARAVAVLLCRKPTPRVNAPASRPAAASPSGKTSVAARRRRLASAAAAPRLVIGSRRCIIAHRS